MEQLVRVVKSARSQGGLLSGAEVALMTNLSLTTVGKYLRLHYERHKEVLPMKGYVLDQGSNPTHKGIIIELYEQAISPADIVLKTGHSQEAVDRYIKTTIRFWPSHARNTMRSPSVRSQAARSMSSGSISG